MNLFTMTNRRRYRIYTFFINLFVLFVGGVVSSITSSSTIDKLSQAVIEFESRRRIDDPHLRSKAKQQQREAQYTLDLLDSAVVTSPPTSLSLEKSFSYNNNNKEAVSPAAEILRLLSENSEYSNSNNNNDESSSSDGQQQYNDDDDRYSSWNQNMVQQDFGFYITAYSFKYTGCHNVVDKENSYPAKIQRFATFRLCPTQSCYEWNANGCSNSNNNYGEYAVPLNHYLSSLLDYNQGRVLSFCEYCQSCAMIESYKSFFHDLIFRQQYTVKYAKAQFQIWLSSSSSTQCNSDNGNDATGDDNQYASASQRLWTDMKNGLYNSSYIYDSQYYHSPVLNSRDSWNIQGSAKSYSSYQDSWRSMVHGSTFGTWFGRLVYPGYFKDDNEEEFVLCWGYYTKTGIYVCLEDTSTLYWDTNLYGSLPDSWTQFLDSDGYPTSPDYVQSCETVDCYDQYDTCLAILKEESESENNDDEQVQQGVQLSLQDVISCTPIYFKHLSSEQQTKITKQQKQYQYQQNNQQYQYQEQAPLFYIGPLCMANNYDTTLAVYTDESCSMLNQKASSVYDILGYDPIKTSMDLFPSECLSCRPNDDEYVWYETSQVNGEVMPVCSMLYQLAYKCNAKLNPSINQDQESEGDACSFIKTLNADRKSWLAQHTWTSDKAPQVLLLVSLVVVFGVAVGYLFMYHNGVEPSRLFDDMSTIGTSSTAYDFESVVSTFHRFDSGISKIRQQSAVGRRKIPSRARTAPAPSEAGRRRTLRQQLGTLEEDDESDQ